MILGFIVGYTFDVSEFLARELRDRAVGSQKTLLANPCMFTRIYLAAGVLEIPIIDEMIESQRKFDIRLIRDTANPLA